MGEKSLIPMRYVIATVCLLGLTNIQLMRATLSVAITQMVEPIAEPLTLKADISICPKPNKTIARSIFLNSTDSALDALPAQHTRFDWSQEMQGFILAAFYYFYAIAQIPSGLIVQKFGAKIVFLVANLGTAIISIITPIGVEWGGAPAMVALRMLMGVCQSGVFSALAALVSAWIPVTERSLLCAIVYSGTSSGIVLGTYFSGLLLHYLGGWHSVFYVFGTIGLLVSAIIAAMCYNRPEDCPGVDDDEKEYLQKNLTDLSNAKDLPSPPWKEIFTNPPVLALILTQVCHDFSFYVVLSDLPKYMNDVLHISIKDNGLYSSIPQASRVIFTFFCGYVSDWIISSGRLSITNTRKLFINIASVFPAIFIMTASYAGCHELLVVTSFTISVSSQGAKLISANLNTIDLSPNYASVLAGITIGIGAFTGILAPSIVGWMTPNSLLTEWRLVFWLVCALHVLKAIVFTIWGTGEVQPFNTPKKSMNEAEEAAELEKLAQKTSL